MINYFAATAEQLPIFTVCDYFREKKKKTIENRQILYSSSNAHLQMIS